MTAPSPAIIGLGATAMSLEPGAVPTELASEAVANCLADANLAIAEIDGLLVSSSQGVRPDRLGVAFARTGGFGDLRLLEHVEIKGATAVSMIQRAVLSISAGMASNVLCVFSDAPLRAGKRAGSTYATSGGVNGTRGMERASGVLGSVPTYALLSSRYLYATGTEEAALGAVAVSARAWAVDNPDAVMRKPLDMDAYLASRMISTPLRVLDCARPVNGAAAILVSSARPGSSTPIHVTGMGLDHPMRRRRAPGESWFGGGRRAATDALAMAGLSQSDIDVIELYDPFSVVTLCLLEEYGFCAPGTAGKQALSGAIAPGGSLPTNTGGGQLSGFYLQGMTPLIEAIEQLRGNGGGRQVAGAGRAFVGGIGGRMDHHAALVLEVAA
ncbi:MAG: putative thiolase [Pseudonocardiales bacterium]|nr:putative thiolase [Pseudonocardiales bacterium]